MFQFRAFPTLPYLIQARLIRYCRIGFPHSEISGSMRMCRSPKLIAACHVLRRLLMPRHSPCALISLTFVRKSSISAPSAQVRSSLHSAFSSSQNRAGHDFVFFRKSRTGSDSFFDASGSQNYAGFRRISTTLVSIVVTL